MIWIFGLILIIGLIIAICCVSQTKQIIVLEQRSKKNNSWPDFQKKIHENSVPDVKWSKIKVRIFSDFCDSDCATKAFLNMCPNIHDYPNITFTSNNDYTHCVILNKAKDEILVPKQYVIGLAHEPLFYLNLTPEFIMYTKQNIGNYYIGQVDNLGFPFSHHISFLWHSSLPSSIPLKRNTMSIIFSNKKETKGQQYRHELVSKILELNLPIDIWGRGCEHLQFSNKQIKGGFIENEPYESYQFTIAIENCEHDFYVSEKFINPLMVSTIPLYCGATCVDKLFPNCFIRLNGNLTKDLKIINNVLLSPNKYIKNVDNYEIAKRCDLVQHLQTIFL
jgi:Glycosyltransferase family 10 (fucosyltransferase) C-term